MFYSARGFSGIHKLYVGIAKAMPTGLGVGMIRALNGVLRLTGRNFLGETAFGAVLRCNPRDLIQVTILHFGVWEPDISSVISNTLKAGDVFVDIGANIGYDTLLASHLVGPTGRVVAVEAAPGTFRELQNNIERNGCDNTRSVNVAASDARGRVSINAGSATNSGSATIVPGDGSAFLTEVDALPLDEILTDVERQRVKLIKIDVEGAECLVLRGIMGALPSYPADMKILVEMASNQADAQKLFEEFLAAGFSAYAIRNSYTYAWYLKWRSPSPPVAILELPDEQTDVLFSRAVVG